MRFQAICCAVLLVTCSEAELLPQQDVPAPEIPLSRVMPDATVPVGLVPGAAAVEDGIWTRDGDGSLIRIDAKTNGAANRTPSGPGVCTGLLRAFDSLWVPSCGDRTLLRVGLKVDAKPVALPISVAGEHASLAAGVGSVWLVTDEKGVLARVDPATNAVVAEIYVAPGAAYVAFDKDAVFVTSTRGDLLTRVNAHTNVVEDTVKVGPRPGPVAAGEGAVWVLNRADRSVTRVDRQTGKAVTTVKTGAGEGEGAIAVGEGAVWVSVPGTPIVRIDPRTNRVTHRFTGDGGGAIAAAHGSIWVGVGSATTWRVDPVLLATLR